MQVLKFEKQAREVLATAPGGWEPVEHTGAALTTSAGSTLLVFFRTQWSINAAGVQCRFYYAVDGGADVQLGLPHCPNISYQTCFSALFALTGLGAGSHTIKIRWSTVSNTLTAHGTDRNLLVVEVRK